MEETETPKPNVSRLALFLAFSRISLSSFGGAIFWARRELVERQRWITEREFVEMFTLGQLLPGPNVLNVTVMFGYRFAGWTGAAAAVAGFLGWPCLVVVGMGILTSITALCRRYSRHSRACPVLPQGCCSPP